MELFLSEKTLEDIMIKFEKITETQKKRSGMDKINIKDEKEFKQARSRSKENF